MMSGMVRGRRGEGKRRKGTSSHREGVVLRRLLVHGKERREERRRRREGDDEMAFVVVSVSAHDRCSFLLAFGRFPSPLQYGVFLANPSSQSNP